MGGVDRIDQNISSYIIGHCSKKWRLPVFHFCLDLSVNNAYQLHRQRKCSEGGCMLDLLGFWQSIVDTYYRCLRRSTITNVLPPAWKLPKVSDEVRYDTINHWIGKGKQQRCTHVRKTLCTFVKNAMFNSIQIVTRSFTARSNLIDILVLWFYKREQEEIEFKVARVVFMIFDRKTIIQLKYWCVNVEKDYYQCDF